MYVNDLSYFTDCKVIQYADGTQFIHTGDINDLQGPMSTGEEFTKKAQLYLHMNDLMLNVNKTQCML